MSWEDHTNDMLSSNKLVFAAVLGKDDGAIYGQSGSVTISESEAAEVANFMKNDANKPSLLIGGNKHMLISYRDNENIAYLKCHNGGLCIGVSKTLIVLGVWDSEKSEAQNAGDCNLVVEKKVKEFEESSY